MLKCRRKYEKRVLEQVFQKTSRRKARIWRRLLVRPCLPQSQTMNWRGSGSAAFFSAGGLCRSAGRFNKYSVAGWVLQSDRSAISGVLASPAPLALLRPPGVDHSISPATGLLKTIPACRDVEKSQSRLFALKTAPCHLRFCSAVLHPAGEHQ